MSKELSKSSIKPSDDDVVARPPSGAVISLGFKGTPESVPIRYTFNQWCKRKVHVLPNTEEAIRRNYWAYERNALYECEYVGNQVEGPFVITEYVKVLPNKCSIVVYYDGSIGVSKWRAIDEVADIAEPQK